MQGSVLLVTYTKHYFVESWYKGLLKEMKKTKQTTAQIFIQLYKDSMFVKQGYSVKNLIGVIPPL